MRVQKDDLLWLVKWVVAFVVAQWARLPQAIVLLLFMMGLDMVTGLLKGFVTARVSSAACAKGLAKKVMVLIVLLVLNLLGEHAGITIELGGTVAWAYVVREVMSILENVNDSGVWVPPQLMATLRRFDRFRGGFRK